METVERSKRIVTKLKEIYPDAGCALEADGDPWKLLLMARLSAQCTDARVNIVCRELFAIYPIPQALADAELADVERILRPCGLYHVKARDVIEESRMLVVDYGGILPNSMEELLKFPGVGRKVANLLFGDVYHQPAVVVDTHCIRISGRLGLVPSEMKNPVQIEKRLSTLIEPSEQSDFCHRIVMFGREYCMARNPSCSACPLKELCPTGMKM